MKAEGLNATATSRKLDIQSCILRDRRLNASAKVMAVYLLEAMNWTDGAAYRSYETICDELNFADRKTAQRNRKQLAEAGWFKVFQSSRTQANTYELGADIGRIVNEHLDLMTVRQDTRKREFEARKQQSRGRQMNGTKKSRRNPPNGTKKVPPR